MANIGILTYHNTTNYGATLQCYALFKHLESLGHSPTLVDYSHPHARLYYWKHLLRSGNTFDNLLKKAHFVSFSSKHFRISRKIRDLKKLPVDQFDAIIVGSDEVWKQDDIRPYDINYFLEGVDNSVCKIAYSPSVGNTDLARLDREEIRLALDKFSCLSGRDRKTVDWIRTCSKKHHPFKTIDPVFLHSFKEFTTGEKPNYPYVLIYGALSEKAAGNVLEWSRENNAKIVSIGHYNQFADVNKISVRVDDWVNYISNASLVVTSFFHGVAFAVKFRKKIILSVDASKTTKIGELFEEGGMSRDYAKRSSVVDLEEEFDYIKLEKEINKSKSYLKNCH